MSLYIGTNYHPHDWEETRWKTDIALMKQAGFTTVRLGHLCWDSFEPDEGVYTFDWFDKVMDLFREASIGVFLDISVRPAPVWVHKLCPGCGITSKSGNAQSSVRRYMEDVSDPAYQYYALRFAKTLVKRYSTHPALFAFGLCNELGDGYLSHSEGSRVRFANWLKHKYKTVDALNRAWAAQRWSRRLTSFDDVSLPENELAVGSPESRLDMRRFLSDEIGGFLCKLEKVVEQYGNGKPHSSNHYAEKAGLGFDYLKFCGEFVDYPGMGFYPGYEVGDKYYFLGNLYQQRLAELGKPMWCLEFQTGSCGIPWGPKGALRMQAMLCLLNRTELILGWTWRTMLGGEEQFLHGMLSHDGVPTQNYWEYRQIAADMKKLEQYAFPYLPEPEIAVAYSYESAWVNEHSASEFRQSYADTMSEVYRTFFRTNRDYNIVDLRKIRNSYKLLIIPGHILMSREAAEAIRQFVKNGGTAVMTGYSATVDETGKVFATARPGYLADVFGIRVAGYATTDMEWTFSGDSVLEEAHGKIREVLQLQRGDTELPVHVHHYDLIELQTAKEYARFKNKNLCAVSVNAYGLGEAYYVTTETNEAVLRWLIASLDGKLHLRKTPDVPDGVQARQIAENQFFYVNTGKAPATVSLPAKGYGVLGEQELGEELVLEQYGAELVVL